MKSRQLDILLFLLKCKKTTYSEITEQFEISKRTAIRDINELSSMGIPIYSQPGYQGGIFIPKEYKLGKSFFTPEEIAGLVLALHLTKHIHKDETERSILEKMELLNPDLVFIKENNYRNRVRVELLQEPISTNPAIWRVIDKAMDEKKGLRITARGNKYVVEPISYVICAEGLLLQCRSKDREFSLAVMDMTECSLIEASDEKIN